jgi:hypothetical protein
MYSLATADMAYTLWLLFGKLLKLDLSLSGFAMEILDVCHEQVSWLPLSLI